MTHPSATAAELPQAIFLMGPTASGKTALTLALAQRLPIEIISVDSAQVFRDMTVGTAKPEAAALAQVPHHLINLISPEESYSAARFRADALSAMAEITARGRIPLLAGGTMLYFRALQNGLSDLPKANASLRAELDAQAARVGWPALHAELARRDPPTAARLAPNDAQRIQRALEVIHLSGEPMSAMLARQISAPLPYAVHAFALVPADRSWLHERIALRFRQMLADGLVEELEGLRRRYLLNDRLPSMRSVGYRQAWDMLEGRIAPSALEDRGIFATRQLAKRQLTWLRSARDVTLVECSKADAMENALAAVASRFAIGCSPE